jgi:hypothetical protein
LGPAAEQLRQAAPALEQEHVAHTTRHRHIGGLRIGLGARTQGPKADSSPGQPGPS